MEEFVIYVELAENWGPEASLDTSHMLRMLFIENLMCILLPALPF